MRVCLQLESAIEGCVKSILMKLLLMICENWRVVQVAEGVKVSEGLLREQEALQAALERKQVV